MFINPDQERLNALVAAYPDLTLVREENADGNVFVTLTTPGDMVAQAIFTAARADSRL